MDGRAEVVVRPGGWHFGGDDAVVRTLLGSCVAITIWHPRARIGGMCHFVVPSRGGRTTSAATMDGRYGDEAMALLSLRAGELCTSLSDYDVRLYGGGNQFRADGPAGRMEISARNVVAARTLVEQHGLRVLATDLGGRGARTVELDLATGAVTTRRAGTQVWAAS